MIFDQIFSNLTVGNIRRPDLVMIISVPSCKIKTVQKSEDLKIRKKEMVKVSTWKNFNQSSLVSRPQITSSSREQLDLGEVRISHKFQF